MGRSPWCQPTCINYKRIKCHRAFSLSFESVVKTKHLSQTAGFSLLRTPWFGTRPPSCPGVWQQNPTSCMGCLLCSWSCCRNFFRNLESLTKDIESSGTSQLPIIESLIFSITLKEMIQVLMVSYSSHRDQWEMTLKNINNKWWSFATCCLTWFLQLNCEV